jgi:hypothetical protein
MKVEKYSSARNMYEENHERSWQDLDKNFRQSWQDFGKYGKIID